MTRTAARAPCRPLASALALTGGVLLLLVSITALLRYSPRRRQPGWSWLALGGALAMLLWLAFTSALGGYMQLTDNFGIVYGPLTAVIALLLWAQLTSIAIFLSLAVAAQLEAMRAGIRCGAPADPERRTASASPR